MKMMKVTVRKMMKTLKRSEMLIVKPIFRMCCFIANMNKKLTQLGNGLESATGAWAVRANKHVRVAKSRLNNTKLKKSFNFCAFLDYWFKERQLVSN